MKQNLPVVVIGAGPVGLAAAAHLLERGLEPLVLEAGASAGAAILQWGHIRLFSTWKYNIDAASRRLLQTADGGYDGGWEAPRETRLPYGAELVQAYLAPLAGLPALRNRVRYGYRVTAVSRIAGTGRTGSGFDKTRGIDRDGSVFLVRAATAGGESELTARAVIDASGTWGQPNPAGRAGLPALGESAARRAGLLTSPLPDPLGADRERFAGRAVLVLGSGHSAANTLISLGRLRQQHPDTRILWGIRGSADPARLYGGGALDQLPARGQLGTSLRRFVENGDIELIEHLSIAALDLLPGNEPRLAVRAADGRTALVDLLVPATGFRPDLAPLSELRLDLDETVEAPRKLGPLIDPEFHSCGTVPPHGETLLAHPEKDFYIAGMKSYGRAPTFLMATGYEQVRSIAAALAGDRAAAGDVRLALPETGVCSTDLGGSCDAPAAEAPSAKTQPSSACCGGATTGAAEEGSCCGSDGAGAAAEASCCGAAKPPSVQEEAPASCCSSGPQPVSIGFATGLAHGKSAFIG